MLTRRMFSNAEAVEMIDAALQVIEDVKPPEDLRVAAFQSALAIVGQREAFNPAAHGGVVLQG